MEPASGRPPQRAPRPAAEKEQPRPPVFVGRREELDLLAERVGGQKHTNWWGPYGAGKSTLCKEFVRRFAAKLDRQEQPVVTRVGGDLRLADMEQSIFEVFHGPGHLAADLPHVLAALDVLIVLDDLRPRDRRGLYQLTGRFTSATFVVTSEDPIDETMALPLYGLGFEDSLTLLKASLGRDPSADLPPAERPQAEELVHLFAGHPLGIRRVAAVVVELGKTVAQTRDQIRRDDAEGWVALQLWAGLDEKQREVLRALRALGEASVAGTCLAALTGVPDADEVAEKLVRIGLAQRNSPRYHIAADLLLDSSPVDLGGGGDGVVLRRFADWADGNRDRPRLVTAETGALLHVLDVARTRRDWSGITRLGRSTDAALMLGGRWDAWRQSLEHQLAGSRSLGDRAGEAWALHQLGTRNRCLGNHGEGRSQLRAALVIRQQLGDVAGEEVTRHNLDFQPPPVPPLIPPPPPGGPPPPPPSPVAPAAAGPAPWTWAAPGATFVAGVVGLGALLLGPADTAVERVAARVVEVAPSRLDFGVQRLGVQTPLRVVTVTNRTEDPVAAGRIQIAGAAPDQFLIGEDRCKAARLDPGATCTIDIGYRPTRLGRSTATLTVDTAAGTTRSTVDLNGTGVSPPSGTVTVEPGVADFGPTVVGTVSPARTVMVRNRGGGPVRIGSVGVTGLAAGDFRSTTDDCRGRTLAPDGACEMRLTFAPVARGARTATLTIAPTGGMRPLQVGLSGSGVTQDPCGPVLSLPPPLRARYGEAVEGTVSARCTGRTVAPLRFQGLSLPGALTLRPAGDGQASVSGVVTAAAGVYDSRVQLVAGDGTVTENLWPVTVERAAVALAWADPLLRVSVGSPATLAATVRPAPGFKGDLSRATMAFRATSILLGQSATYGPVRASPDGLVTFTFPPGLGLGVYLVDAVIDPANPYFESPSRLQVAISVSTDALGATVYVPLLSPP